MHTIDLRAEIDENDEIRVKVPAGYVYQWARIHVNIPDRGNADPNQTPVSAPATEAMPRHPLKMGLFRGRIQMADDFNDPLPDSFWLDGNPGGCYWTPRLPVDKRGAREVVGVGPEPFSPRRG